MSDPRTVEPAGTLWLEAPNWAELDRLTQRQKPWVLWHIGFQTVLAHWMDEAVRRNMARVEIIAPDRPTELERELGDGVYWSRDVRVHPTVPEDAPAERESMALLPGQTGPDQPYDEKTMLSYWLDVQLAWLSAREESISVDRQLHPRVWVGPGVQIHPAAKICGPCWIGSRAQIGADATVGPNAIVGVRSVVDGQASVENAVVQSDTFVGAHLHLDHMIADGATLFDLKRHTRVELTDRFMLSRLRTSFWSWLTGSRRQS